MTTARKKGSLKKLLVENPWAAAFDIPVIRGNPPFWPPEPLEPGVKFFVLMLEQLGAKTLFSCEGHPLDFYIFFKATRTLATRIAACGFLTVEVAERERGHYRLSLLMLEYLGLRGSSGWGEEDRCRILCSASRAWVKAFGPLRHPALKEKP